MKAWKAEIKEIGHLRKRADFLRVQSAGRKWVTPNLIIQIAPMPPTPNLTCRLGLTVTKKIFPKSVDRNRVRRRYRALFLSVIGEFKGKGHDFVLLPRGPALKTPSADLEKDLKWALKRVLDPDFAAHKAKNGKKNG